MMGTPLDESGRYPNEKLHEVRITRAYLLGAHEVTRGQFRIFVKDTRYKSEAEKRDLLSSGSERGKDAAVVRGAIQGLSRPTTTPW